MQLQLPIFPPDAKLINNHVGVNEKGGIVQYIVNGLPVYSHSREDHNAFRFITSNFIHQELCRKVDIERCFGVSEDSVSRTYKKFVNKGEEGFFGEESRHGHSHKINGDRKLHIQSKLDKGQSVNSIAKEERISESSIRYAIGQGYFKKKLNL